MANHFDILKLNENPQNILGLPRDAGPGEIRTAYLNKIKEYPPEKFPAEFERVRDAYTMLSDARYRTRLMLRSADPEASMEKLLDDQQQNKQFVGPEAWMAAMQER
jgi:DnaJ-class molecular chaperone